MEHNANKFLQSHLYLRAIHYPFAYFTNFFKLAASCDEVFQLWVAEIAKQPGPRPLVHIQQAGWDNYAEAIS